MPYSIDREKANLTGELRPFKDFLSELDSDIYKFDYFDNFRQIVETVYVAFQKTIEGRLASFPPGLLPEEASGEFSDLRSILTAVYNFLYITTFKNMTSVPRELYYLTDSFLEKCSLSPTYVLSLGEQIEVTDFRWFLQKLQVETVYPEFWLAYRGRSIDWPLIIHEMGHIVDLDKGIVKKVVPNFDYYTAFQILRRQDDPLLKEQYPIAQKVAKLSEYVADFLSTQYVAGAFGWRFLSEYLTVKGIFEEPLTHPDLNKRIAEMIDQINKLDLPEVAKIIEQTLETTLKDAGKKRVAYQREFPELDRVFDESRKLMGSASTREEIRRILHSRLKGSLAGSIDTDLPKLLTKLQESFFQGRPLVVEPSVLFLIYMYGLEKPNAEQKRQETFGMYGKRLKKSGSEFEELIQELLADCIKLYEVHKSYVALGAPDAAPAQLS